MRERTEERGTGGSRLVVSTFSEEDKEEKRPSTSRMSGGMAIPSYSA